jgi:hypothetical protein
VEKNDSRRLHHVFYYQKFTGMVTFQKAENSFQSQGQPRPDFSPGRGIKRSPHQAKSASRSIVFALERFDVFQCATLAASYAALVWWFSWRLMVSKPVSGWSPDCQQLGYYIDARC